MGRCFLRLVLLAPIILAACENADVGSTGRLVLYVNGGNEARDGIAASRFADGYAVEYEHAVLTLSSLHLQTMDGDSADVDMPPRVVDLVPDAHEIFEVGGLPAQRWNDVGFSSHPPHEGVQNLNAPEELVEEMIEKGYSHLQTGTLTAPDGTRIPFELGFPVRIDYFSCTSGDGTYGVVITPQGVTEAEITWHLTHLWFDSFAEDSAFRAEAVAAAWDGSNPVRTEDLAQQALADLRNGQGEPLTDELGNPVLYIPPQELGVETLRDFVLRARFGHFNGLAGSCDTEVEVVP